MLKLETERLILRNYETEDFEDIKKYFADEEVSRYEDFDLMSDEQIKEIIEEWKTMDNRLVAEQKESGVVVGKGMQRKPERHWSDICLKRESMRFTEIVMLKI